VTAEELGQLVSDCPFLYHVASKESWPAIREHGLLPAASLGALFGLGEEELDTLTTRRRATARRLAHPRLGSAVLRDQIPLLERDLARCLRDGLTPSDWLRMLSERVFFWLSEQRVRRLLCATSNRGEEHLVLRVRSAELIRDHTASIELSPINSGATRPFPAPRGRDTFLSVADYPYSYWRGRRPRCEAVVELTVVGGVPNIADYINGVSIHGCGRADAPYGNPDETIPKGHDFT
jgi:hypothetical protein